jgi:rhodanese-related sulfurtransferase
MADTRDEAARAPVPAVEVGALLPRLDRGEKVLLLDVRNEEEFDAWKVEARRPVETVHVPYFDFIEDADASIAKVPRDREVVAYEEWMSRARPAILHSPDGTRRPYWLLRPLKPGREAYKLPGPRFGP